MVRYFNFEWWSIRILIGLGLLFEKNNNKSVLLKCSIGGFKVLKYKDNLKNTKRDSKMELTVIFKSM